VSLDVAALHAAHADRLVAYFERRVGDPALAEDLAQDVWVRVVRHADRFRDIGAPVESFLYSIARNLLTDHRRHVALPQTPQRLGDRAPVLPAPRDEIARVADRLLLDDALAALTPQQRAAIVGRFYEGRCMHDLAHIATADGIKKLQQRALVNLRRILGRAA
jgi:RNA polymerase sigma-70 factor, ECF subfamily